MKYVIVIEKDGSVKQRVPYKTETGAKVYLYDKEARLVWEADNGVRYTDSIPYETRRLFYEIRFVELYKNRRMTLHTQEKEEKTLGLSFETLKHYGMQQFDKQEIFLLCSKRIREQENLEDDFLLYLCFELTKEGFYDKAVLNYLAEVYCGATGDMKYVWQKAREYGVNTKALAERIITQMLFSETMFCEEEIFEDYYSGRPYFRLKQAYLAYVARMYISKNRVISENMIRIMMQELGQKEYLADICKVAILKFYAGKQVEIAMETTLKEFFMEMCEMRMVFPFYLCYPQEWLKEVQLYDKVLVEYRSVMEGKVKVAYRVQKENVPSDEYYAEVLLPMYDNVYVKEFVLYEGEVLNYYFEEATDEEIIASKIMKCKKEHIVYEDGKYGRLNLISRFPKDKRYEAMLHYKKEEKVAEVIFETY